MFLYRHDTIFLIVAIETVAYFLSLLGLVQLYEDFNLVLFALLFKRPQL
jgi:hypothetical protein